MVDHTLNTPPNTALDTAVNIGAAEAGAPLTLVPLSADWTVPDTWPLEAVFDEDEDEQRYGYDARAEYWLDLHRRELSIRMRHTDDPDEREPGGWLSWLQAVAGVVPRRLRLDSVGLRGHEHLADPGPLNTLLDDVAPLAQHLADTLTQVPGTSARDWTCAAWDAYKRACHLVDRRPQRGTQYDFPYERSLMVDAADLFAEFPELVHSGWAELSDAALDDTVTTITKHQLYDLKRDPSAAARLHALAERTAGRPLPPDRSVTFAVFGVRAWLYSFRARQAHGRAPVDAARWTGGTALAPRVRADLADTELDTIAAEAVATAAADGVKLLGARAWLLSMRAERRREVRAELARTAEEIAALEARLKPTKVRRRALLTGILAWGEESDTDAALARAAGLSHTAVRNVRETLNHDEDADAE
ncbi:MAG: hypothetical protein HOV68_02135 [Streptomycetaceae bacterium]|nr:hypothetical protein [Streptomycetaceae bacterium]